MNYPQSIFYDCDSLTLKTWKQIIMDAYEVNQEWYVDILKSNDLTRNKTNMSIEKILSKLNKKCHFVVIQRYDFIKEGLYGEIGFSTYHTKEPTYFLFVFITIENLNKIIEKFNLNKIY